ncbi:hypothetical protein CTM76_17045 [Photobacterium phosphoreum]|uniref:ABC-three component system protein n=1 Tax=Photobacterium phosphoreum TaxID=659 RepID=UPI0007F93D2A|nr:ABC-three component system protein [Photobacterium phosphoreum]OBU41673.1 hypothetical protein AYY25_00995 [Photobacterium phosphoreum]PSU76094.1 hypothetical protein CTM76_17045 [Photobacterium phosphoreum]
MDLFNKLKNVWIGGDYAGRDIINNVMPTLSQIEKLSSSYKDEVTNKQKTTTFIDELNHYHTKKEEIRDLTTKLTAAGLSDYIDEAEKLKELISKLIIKYQNYRSAQKIITYLLAEVESIFNSQIKPKLNQNMSIHEMKALLRVCLELELNDKLGENVLEIYNRQINGMVFFLTGNCHLEWD